MVDQVFEPSSMVISDLADHVGLIGKNVDINSCRVVSLQEYDWCHIPSIGTFDIILVLEWCVR